MAEPLIPETPETPDTAVTGSLSENKPFALGDALQAARVAKKLTLQDVSNSLRYSVKQINALENGEYQLLPDAMITRGFIRNYAKLLEIDPEPLLADYRQKVSSDSDRIIVVQSSMRPVQLTQVSQSWTKYVVASIVVLVCVLAWLYYMDYKPAPSTPATQTITQPSKALSSAAVETLPEIALPAAQRLAEVDAAGQAIPASADIANASEVVNQRAVDAPDANSAGANAIATNAVEIPVKVDFKPTAPQVVQSNFVQATSSPAATSALKPAYRTITLAFTAQTWVNATDKSGKRVYEKMSYNGDKQTLNTPLPITLVIGNASGTQLHLDGKDIELAPYTKSNVARITLE